MSARSLPSENESSDAVNDERELLVVSYHFPPIQSPGVYRVLGLVTYLRALGWRITVLTVRRSTIEPGDDALVALIPEDVAVIRTDSPEPVARLTRAAAAARAAAQGTVPNDGARVTSQRKSAIRRLLSKPGRALVRAMTYPDYQIGWVPRVAKEVRKFVREHPNAVVLSSTPPHSTHLGVRLARAGRHFAWVTDFRDPWTAPARNPKGPVNLAFQRALERWVLLGCDHVIANTAGNKAELLASFPGLDAARVSVVTNAFDTATLPASASPDDPAVACDMAYFGELYPGMLDPYLAALRVLVAREPRAAPRLHVFGRVGDTDVRRVREEGLSSYVVFMGTVSYQRSLALMRAAPSLLLLLPEGESMATCIPSKFFPYLFTGRRILAFVPPGDAARAVDETGSGEVIAPGDPESGASALGAFIDGVRRAETRERARPDEGVLAYAMDHIARRVHAILEGAAARG